MKNFLCLLLLTGALAAQAQTPANDLLRHIPADADQVVDVNLGMIVPKIDVPALMNIVGSKARNNKMIADIPKFMNAGVDIHQDLIFAQTNTNHPDSVKYQTVIFHLIDSAKFSALLRNLAKESAAPMHYLHPTAKLRVAVHGHGAFAYTDKLAILVMATAPTQSSGNPLPLATFQARAARRCAMALEGFGNTRFLTDEHFATTFADGGDIHIWNLNGSLYSLLNKAMQKMPADKMGQFGSMAQLMNGNKSLGQSIATIRFDNGSIKYTTLKFMPPNQLSAAKLMIGQGLSPELTALVPPRQILGVVTLHFDMQALADSLKRNPMFPMIDTMLQSKGVSAMDLFNAFKGDFMFVACTPDPDKSTTDSSGHKKMPAPTLYIVSTINGKASFEKIISLLKLKDVSTLSSEPMDTDTAHHKKNPFPYYNVQNDLVVCGKFSQAREFFTKGSNNDPIGKLLFDQTSSNASSINIGIDIHALITNVLGGQAGGDKTTQALGQFQTLQIAAGAIHGDAMETKIELRFADQNKNSLGNLIDIFSTLMPQHLQATPGQ